MWFLIKQSVFNSNNLFLSITIIRGELALYYLIYELDN